MSFDLRRDLRRGARDTAQDGARRLRRDVGVGGAPLARKARPDGSPLGGRRLPRLLRRPSVTLRPDGFRLRYTDRALVSFLAGTRHQPARPVHGVDRQRRAKIVAAIRRSVVRQINRRLRRAR